MAQLRRLKGDEKLPELIESVNRIFDTLLGNKTGRLALIDDDGELREIAGGASLGSSEPSLKIRSGIGEHLLIEHSNGIDVLLEVQDSGVTIFNLQLDSLTINGWTAEADGDDIVWKEDGGAERVRFGDSASTYALLATGDLKTTTALTINDWKASVSGDDLVWVDDAGSEMVRFGDSASTYHLKVTGPAQITGLLNLGGNLTVTGANYIEMGATPAGTGAIRLTNNTGLYERNAGNSADVAVIRMDGSNDIFIGDGTNNNAVRIFASAVGRIGIGSTNFIAFDSTAGDRLGFLGATAVTRPTLAAAATDLATAITLANSLRSCLQNNGLAT